MRRCDSLRTITTDFFVRPLLPRVYACVRHSAQARRRPGAGALAAAAPDAAVTVESQGVPCSWGTLLCLCRGLRPRRNPNHQALRWSDAAPAWSHNES